MVSTWGARFTKHCFSPTLALSPLIPSEGKVAVGLDRGSTRAYGAKCGIVVCDLGVA